MKTLMIQVNDYTFINLKYVTTITIEAMYDDSGGWDAEPTGYGVRIETTNGGSYMYGYNVETVEEAQERIRQLFEDVNDYAW